MPPKSRKLSDLSDDEIEAERRRRKAANRPRTVRIIEMDEEQYKKLFGKPNWRDYAKAGWKIPTRADIDAMLDELCRESE